ncbi:MAG: hydrogen peroxide-inducible genes activator, partial [Proteobacteria bacterium]|nr:hydrogen peroxide-inducible genes activator [Pseudomonadota bacterium]
QVQKLEEELNTVIFDRSKKPIILTARGEELLAQMQCIVFEAKKVTAILESHSGQNLKGLLTVGIIPTVAPYLLPKLLPVIEKKYPDLSLKILELQTHSVIEALNSDAIDLGIVAIPLKVNHIKEKSLYFENFSVLCQKTHPLAARGRVDYKELKSDDIWLLEEGHCLRNQVLDVCALNESETMRRQFEFESGSLETLKNLVNAYGGYTLLPAFAAETIGSNTVTVHFIDPVPSREIGVVYVREHYKMDLQNALVEAIVSIKG